MAKVMRIADALRIVNKCRRMYPRLDFTNIALVDHSNYVYRFGAESVGICNGKGDIYIQLPMVGDFPLSKKWRYGQFMRTLVHEAIHRYVLFTYGLKHHGHGKKFQEVCLQYGLDPFKETAHDETVKRRIYPINKKDYKKYRNSWGDMKDPVFDIDNDVAWALREKHDKTYDRKCYGYIDHLDAVKNMRLCGEETTH